MNESKLLASVSLFRELYDNKKDIYDVLSGFIQAGIIHNRKWVFNSKDITYLLKQEFDFDIPEAVIKSTLKNRLKKSGFITNINGGYSVSSREISTKDSLSNDVEKTQEKHEKAIVDVLKYISTSEFSTLKPTPTKDQISKALNNFLLDNKITDLHSQIISSFLIKKSKSWEYTRNLNIIKEGLVLYAGIRYTADLNELGAWKDEITIFLDTEHLFSAAGYNGLVYQEIFDDFYNLVTEVNRYSQRKKQRDTIHLRYFEENKQEIENFFHVARLIIENAAQLDPSKTAMVSIIEGCKTRSDILAQKTSFYSSLKSMKIKLEENRNYYLDTSYNIEDPITSEILEKRCSAKNINFNENQCHNFLKLFTKINVLRQGINNTSFEKSKYIFLTGNKFAQFLAFQPEIRFKEKDIPFATDIYFLTNRLWFKLKKGFGTNVNTPKSFDIVTKAKIVLSSQINTTVSKEYENLKNNYNNNKISKDEALSLNYELRSKTSKPEELNEMNIDNALSFLNEDSLERYREEKTILLQKVKEGKKAKEELQKIKFAQKIKSRKEKKIVIKKQLNWLFLENVLAFLLLLISIIVLTSLAILYLKGGDTTLSIIFGIMTFISLILPLLSISRIKLYLKRRYTARCKKILKK